MKKLGHNDPAYSLPNLLFFKPSLSFGIPALNLLTFLSSLLQTFLFFQPSNLPAFYPTFLRFLLRMNPYVLGNIRISSDISIPISYCRLFHLGDNFITYILLNYGQIVS